MRSSSHFTAKLHHPYCRSLLIFSVLGSTSFFLFGPYFFLFHPDSHHFHMWLCQSLAFVTSYPGFHNPVKNVARYLISCYFPLAASVQFPLSTDTCHILFMTIRFRLCPEKRGTKMCHTCQFLDPLSKAYIKTIIQSPSLLQMPHTHMSLY